MLASARALFRSQSELALVELALLQQLAAYSDRRSRPRLTRLDHAFWVFLSRIWPRWTEVLSFVHPQTVVRSHRKGFRLYWRSISRRGPGRPHITPELQDLIRRLATEDDWRGRKIQAELEKLGFNVSLATVSRYVPKPRPRDGQRQRWVGIVRRSIGRRRPLGSLDYRGLAVSIIAAHGAKQLD